jgi:RHS repeat-associated protein
LQLADVPVPCGAAWADVYVEQPAVWYQTWFDDFEITLLGAPVATIVQESHNDPWGLELSGPHYQTGRKNQWQANGKTEREANFGINILETPFRGYEKPFPRPALGRFHQPDAITDLLPGISSYTFAFNNPVMFNDPTGLVGVNSPQSKDASQYPEDPAGWSSRDNFGNITYHGVNAQGAVMSIQGGVNQGGGGNPANPPTGGAGSNGAQSNWGGGVQFASKADANLIASDINDLFKAIYKLNYDVLSLQTVKNGPVMMYRFVTNDKFEWNTDRYTKAIWDVLNADQAITGQVIDMGKEKGLMGLNTGRNTFVVHNEVKTFGHLMRSSFLTVGAVAIHELIYHKHRKFYIALREDYGDGAVGTLYNHFRPNSNGSKNPIPYRYVMEDGVKKPLYKSPTDHFSGDYFIEFTWNSGVNTTTRKRK